MTILYTNVIHRALANTLAAPQAIGVPESAAIHDKIITFKHESIRAICIESFLTNDIVIYFRSSDEASKKKRLFKVVNNINVGLGEIKMYRNIKKMRYMGGISSDLPCLDYYFSKIMDDERIFICVDSCDIDLKTLFIYCEKQKVRLDLKKILLPIWLGIFKGLHYLHTRNIVFNNLKLECLVMRNKTIKLINFENSFAVVFVNSFATNAIFDEFTNLNNVIKMILRMGGYTPECIDKKIKRLYYKCQYNKFTLQELIDTTQKLINN